MKKTDNLEKINFTHQNFFTYETMFKMIFNKNIELVRNILNGKSNDLEKNNKLNQYVLDENFNLELSKKLLNLIEDKGDYETGLSEFLEQDQDDEFVDFHQNIIWCLMKYNGYKAIKCMDTIGISFSISDCEKMVNTLFERGFQKEEILELVHDNPILYNITKEYNEEHSNYDIYKIQLKLSNIGVFDHENDYSFINLFDIYEDNSDQNSSIDDYSENIFICSDQLDHEIVTNLIG